MKLGRKIIDSPRGRAALALAVNLLFLALVLCCFTPRFETNDDVLMSKFVDGQMGEKSAYVPFINIILGALLKGLYSMYGGLNWYSLCQYLTMVLGFWAIGWVLLERLPLTGAAAALGTILFTVGMNVYLYVTFSKTCAVATAGGLALMLQAGSPGRKRRRLPLVLGIALALLGYLWRIEEFFALGAILAPVGLAAMGELLEGSKGQALKEKLKGLLRYAAPFALLLALVMGCLGLDTSLWYSGEMKAFSDYSLSRSRLMDNGSLPSYDQARETYEALGITETALEMLAEWNFFDTQVFSQEQIDALLELRDSQVSRHSPGECLGIFLDKAAPGLAATLAFWAGAIMLLLWLSCGGRRWYHWMGAGLSLGIFGLIYLFMIWQERYLAARVDTGLFLALALALAFMLDRDKIKTDRVFCLLLLALALFLGIYKNKNVCLISDQYAVEDKSSQKAAVEQILEDEEHLYLCKVWSMDHQLYGPLELPPQGFADRIVLAGGWSMYHPSITHVLEKWGIENPYRDMIGNEDVYLIDRDIDQTLSYIRHYYDPGATAKLIEPLSTDTGLMIYQIQASQ